MHFVVNVYNYACHPQAIESEGSFYEFIYTISRPTPAVRSQNEKFLLINSTFDESSYFLWHFWYIQLFYREGELLYFTQFISGLNN